MYKTLNQKMLSESYFIIKLRLSINEVMVKFHNAVF
jgi:hypothetical protein